MVWEEVGWRWLDGGLAGPTESNLLELKQIEQGDAIYQNRQILRQDFMGPSIVEWEDTIRF